MANTKISMLEEIFNDREETLSERIGAISNNKQEFLKIVEQVENEELKKKLKKAYFQDEDMIGTDCANLCKQYYCNGFADGTNLIIECIKEGKV